MRLIRNHLSRCFVGGIVALLPLVSLVLTIVYLESQLGVSFLRESGYYFFGLGLIIAAVLVYLVGLVVTNFIGRWIWNFVDRLIDRLPILGNLYQTFKQILGYGEGPSALFQRVVFVPARDTQGVAIGLVTNEKPFESDESKSNLIAVFLPTAPSPAGGRLIFVERDLVHDAKISVNEALKSLVSIGTVFGDQNNTKPQS